VRRAPLQAQSLPRAGRLTPFPSPGTRVRSQAPTIFRLNWKLFFLFCFRFWTPRRGMVWGEGFVPEADRQGHVLANRENQSIPSIQSVPSALCIAIRRSLPAESLNQRSSVASIVPGSLLRPLDEPKLLVRVVVTRQTTETRRRTRTTVIRSYSTSSGAARLP